MSSVKWWQLCISLNVLRVNLHSMSSKMLVQFAVYFIFSDNVIASSATNGAVVIWDLHKISRSKQGQCNSKQYIDGLVQERRNSSVLAMELRLSCTNPSISANEYSPVIYAVGCLSIILEIFFMSLWSVVYHVWNSLMILMWLKLLCIHLGTLSFYSSDWMQIQMGLSSFVYIHCMCFVFF